MPQTRQGSHTTVQILDRACELTQARGYNAFSFRDLAQQVGIRSASIHHHFPTKADLGRAMMKRYHEHFADQLAAIDASGQSPPEKLRAFFDLSRQTVGTNCGVCLGGMLAADVLTLRPDVRAELDRFFTHGEEWLTRLLEEGFTSRELSVTGAAGDVAVTIIGALQGAMMVARAHGDVQSFDRASRWLLDSLTMR